jgi:hypothetical protein
LEAKMEMRHPRRLTAGALVLAFGFAGVPARATPTSDRADAEGLSAAAAVLVDAGDYVHACAKYEAATRLDPNPRRFIKLAECFERAGMTSRAWMSFGDAEDLALLRGDRALAQSAGAHTRRLEGKLARVAVVVPPDSDIQGLEVRRDGALVSEAVRGIPVPVDPGSHVISATAPGRRAWSATIGLSSGKTAVSIVIPVLEVDRSAAPHATLDEMKTERPLLRAIDDVDLRGSKPSPTIEGADLRDPLRISMALERTPEAPLLLPEDPGKSQRTIAWIMGGAGVASVVGGALFALQANESRDALSARCNSSGCAPAAAEDFRVVRNQAMASNILFWAGATAVAGAAVVYLTAPSAKPLRETASIRFAPSVAPTGAGLFASGRF